MRGPLRTGRGANAMRQGATEVSERMVEGEARFATRWPPRAPTVAWVALCVSREE